MTATTAPTPTTNHGGALLWRIFFGVFITVALLLFLFVTVQPITVLPRISLAPGFAFSDYNGRMLSNESLRGTIVLYSFTYANCTTDCPQTGPVMAQVQEIVRGMKTNGVPVQLVTISVDPERDTPEQLAAYAAQHGADDAIWRVVTGTPAQLKAVIGGGFNTYFTTLDDGSIRLDPALILVDGNGIMRAEYRTAVPDLSIINRDIGLLVEEAHNSEGINRYAYEAAHLFLCYP